MEELSEFSTPVVEFKSSSKHERLHQLVDSCVGTDSVSSTVDVAVETNRKSSVASQTQTFNALETNVDDMKLAAWIRKIYPRLEAELLKGLTPLPDSFNANNYSLNSEEYLIQTYQKISMGSVENSQGLSTWLSVHTNNAPVLVLTTVSPHDDWCEHIDQCLKVFVPKRVQTGNFVVFTEMKSVPLKSCLRTLCTNAFNKNIFAGSTLSGDIYIWEYKINGSATNIEIVELFVNNSPHGCAVAMDWSTENRLLTCHANGWVLFWNIGKHMHLEKSFHIEPKMYASHELTSLLSTNNSDFVVGTNDGGVYHCLTSSVGSVKTNIEIVPLRRHLFMVSTLVQRNMGGYAIVVSADISGQVYYHDINNADEDTPNVIVQIPLPFKNTVSCSRNGNIIYSPGSDGSLECYRVSNGEHFSIKGALQGKGNLIKCSENGLWIITGLYGDEFQIFNVELD